jgi:hypothetical protein
VNECRTDARGLLVGRQSLRVRRGDCDPVTVTEIEGSEPIPDPIGICRTYGEYRTGSTAVLAGALQRLGVSRDGSVVAFELTTDFALFPLTALPPDRAGIYVVRSDGSGLRRLGAASRAASFRVSADPSSPLGIMVTPPQPFAFNPGGRAVAFTDLGPGPMGEQAAQVVTLDLASGARKQVTRLPAATPTLPGALDTGFVSWLDADTLVFYSYANPDGLNPGGEQVVFTVKTDGTGLRAAPVPVVLPGSRVVPTFAIAGGRGAAVVTLTRDAMPVNPIPPPPFFVQDVFFLERQRLLQLTNFGRMDTLGWFVGTNRRAYFTASADPLGTNPSENCQIFSLDPLRGHLRQHTRFQQGDHADRGCFANALPGCRVAQLQQDPVTDTVLFVSNCDPLGANPHGDQLFAMRPDGSGLRQLTDARGAVVSADGSVMVELPGPWAYSAARCDSC